LYSTVIFLEKEFARQKIEEENKKGTGYFLGEQSTKRSKSDVYLRLKERTTPVI